MLQVRYYGDPVLRKKALPIESFDEKLDSFIDEMIETMIEADGVGLAAPQVGVSVQLAVIDVTGGEKPAIVLINPEIIYRSEEMATHEEGCLSLPDINLNVTRPAIVSVKALDRNGHEFTIENATELLCRALQHEIDHLNGIMIVDHVSVLQRQLLKGKLKKLAKEQVS